MADLKDALCPSCLCEGSLVRAIVPEFSHCVECRTVFSEKPKIKQVERVSFGIANKSVEEAITRLQEINDSHAVELLEGSFTRIEKDYSGNYYVKFFRVENNAEIKTRMDKAVAKKEALEVKKEKKRQQDLLAKEKKRQQNLINIEKNKEKKRLLEQKNKLKVLEIKKFQDLLASNGISLETVKEIFR